MKKRYRVMSALALCSVVLLGACSKDTKSATQASNSSAKVEKSSQASSSKSQAAKDKSAQSSVSSQDDQANQSQQDQASTDQEASSSKDANTQSASQFDTAAVASGDFSSIAGSYTGQNGSGITLIINSDQTGAISKSDGDFPAQFSNFSQSGEVATFTNEYGWTYYVVPAGVETPSPAASSVSQWDDSSKDRIVVIGEGVNVFY